MNKQAVISIFFLAGFIFIGALIFILNNSPRSEPQSGKLSVAASFYPLYFFSQQIGGDKASVINITPAGAEPHDYGPTARDIARIENSRLLILNGGGLEAWGDNIKQNLNFKKIVIVTVGTELANQRITEAGKNLVDPHIWLSPALAEKIVDKITQGFAQADPLNQKYYQSNAAELKTRLSNLNLEYQRGLSDCSEKDIITAHAAFGYLAAAFGFNQVALAGLSPDAEPSPRQMAELVKFAKARNVKYIFFESLVSPKLSETIANEIGARTLALNPIEGLSGQAIAQGKNYFTEMKNNLINLRIALQCR